MLTIRATDSGFHTMSPLGSELAPNAFLRTAVNIDGTIVLDPDSSEWLSAESFRYAGSDIIVNVTFASSAQGQAAHVTVREISYLRITDGQAEIVGHMDLGEGISVSAYRGRVQPGQAATWQADIADQLEDLVQSDGFRFIGGSGNDVFAAHVDIRPIYGAVTLRGREGDDSLSGSLSDDLIRGGIGDDIISDDSGTNQLFGGRGDDEINSGVWSEHSHAEGGAGDDLITSSNGDDYLRGNAGHDQINGGRGEDRLIGNGGHDVLDAGEGADRLAGGRGDDTLTGGWGEDTFIFRGRDRGQDTITDFDLTEDVIRFVGTGLSYQDLSFTDNGDHVVITWDAPGRSITLDWVSADQLDEDVFQF